MKFSQAIKGFTMVRQSEGYSPRTLDAYQRDLERMCAHLGDPEIASIHLADLRAYLLYMRAEYVPSRPDGDKTPLAPGSIGKIWCAIRSFFGWAQVDLGVPRPDLQLTMPKWLPKEVVPFTDDDIRALLGTCNRTRKTEGRRNPFDMARPTAKRDRALLLFLLDTGVRASELARLTIGDVDLQKGEVSIKPYLSGKKSRPRTVYIGRGARSALWKYLTERGNPEPDEPLFLSSKTESSLDRSGLRQLIVRLARRAGVKNAHPHKFRHTFAIQFLRNGGDVFSLQRLLGHSSLAIVKHYLALADDDAGKAHKGASPVDRWSLR